MIQCKSCDTLIEEGEQLKTLLDGTQYIEDFCGFCLKTYVTDVDSLQHKEYAFETLTGRQDPEVYDFSYCDS